jgi:hypothetical protein
MVFVPSVASIVGGQMISYWELDPTDTFGASGDLQQDLRVALAHQNSKLHNVYDTATVVLPLRTGIADFFVERAGSSPDSLRWTRQANFRMIASAGLTGFLPSDATNMVVGSLYMRWATTFKNPQIQASLTVPIQAVSDEFRRPTGTDRLFKLKGDATQSNYTGGTPLSYYALDGTVVNTTFASLPLTDGDLNYSSVLAIDDDQVIKSYGSQAEIDTLYQTAMYRLKAPDASAVYPVTSTVKDVIFSTDDESQSSAFTIEDLDTGEVLLYPRLASTGVVNSHQLTPLPSCSWYSLPCIVARIASGACHVYQFVKENEAIIEGAWTIGKGIATLLAVTVPFRQDVIVLGREAALAKHYPHTLKLGTIPENTLLPVGVFPRVVC